MSSPSSERWRVDKENRRRIEHRDRPHRSTRVPHRAHWPSAGRPSTSGPAAPAPSPHTPQPPNCAPRGRADLGTCGSLLLPDGIGFGRSRSQKHISVWHLCGHGGRVERPQFSLCGESHGTMFRFFEQRTATCADPGASRRTHLSSQPKDPCTSCTTYHADRGISIYMLEKPIEASAGAAASPAAAAPLRRALAPSPRRCLRANESRELAEPEPLEGARPSHRVAFITTVSAVMTADMPSAAVPAVRSPAWRFGSRSAVKRERRRLPPPRPPPTTTFRLGWLHLGCASPTPPGPAAPAT